jgi:hypothetical protein
LFSSKQEVKLTFVPGFLLQYNLNVDVQLSPVTMK